MSLLSELNKVLRIKEIKRSKHLFPIKDSTFRNKDLIEGIKVILSKNVTMSKVTKKFEKVFSKKIRSPYSLMVNSGSSANLLAFQCLINPYRKKKIKKRRRSSNTFNMLAYILVANYSMWLKTSFCRC